MAEFREKVHKILSADEGSNKRRNVESITTSSMSNTSNKENKKSNQCLEFLCSRIKSLEERIEHNNVINDIFIKLMVKEVAKITFNLNIYLSKDEFKAKEVLFAYFEANALLPINTNSTAKKIIA
ncbi:hypothetical protein C1645_826660 [Glomus cerebriforme]|uniref:Uncharacterized protein n=1 Tax=Glomus cerebriforme TaxID=658196 RepID=A0A397SUI0_9GLOM|nr:hypothetical protein C1645_826660 [Glomus cerebriforme]